MPCSQYIKLPSFPIGNEGFLQGCQILPARVPFLPTLFAVGGGEEGKKKRKEKNEEKGDGSQMDSEQGLRVFFLANTLSVAGAFSASLKGQWGGKKRLRSSR